MKKTWISTLFAVLASALTCVPAAAESRMASEFGFDDTQATVLASGRSPDGEREIAIVELNEDGAPGLALVGVGPSREARAGGPSTSDFSWVEYASLAYFQTTGTVLPALVERRMLELDQAIDSTLVAQPWYPETNPGTPRQTCPRFSDGERYSYDCKIHGDITRTETSTPYVCLLTTAISGGHTMQMAYKSLGTFYYNATVNVAAGKSYAVQVKSVNRTRRARIFNAVGDYSRFAFNGSFSLPGLNTFGLSPCEQFIANN